eukprot:TRINITY_DN639_c0_g2_i5.p2 TRINITY_DN639_c0_g2~~TRINITY_DN639_c0_g2_i5.p2  ORF type:complete len:211 (-),score=18.91 TRINITY_DN639_c0_g2_i5:1112-1744(-)
MHRVGVLFAASAAVHLLMSLSLLQGSSAPAFTSTNVSMGNITPPTASSPIVPPVSAPQILNNYAPTELNGSTTPPIGHDALCSICLNISGAGFCRDSNNCVLGTRDQRSVCPTDLWQWNTCNSTRDPHTYFNDILLIIYFNSNRAERLPLLRGWSNVFPNMVFTGMVNPMIPISSIAPMAVKISGSVAWFKSWRPIPNTMAIWAFTLMPS